MHPVPITRLSLYRSCPTDPGSCVKAANPALLATSRRSAWNWASTTVAGRAPWSPSRCSSDDSAAFIRRSLFSANRLCNGAGKRELWEGCRLQDRQTVTWNENFTVTCVNYAVCLFVYWGFRARLQRRSFCAQC